METNIYEIFIEKFLHFKCVAEQKNHVKLIKIYINDRSKVHEFQNEEISNFPKLGKFHRVLFIFIEFILNIFYLYE